jgi:hypothetical protein
MNDNLKGQSFSSLPRPQKTAVIILSIAALGIFGVWFWQFNMRLNKPFLPSAQEIAVGEKAAADKLAKENAEKIKDTDLDGLSDYDEVNLYKTSPYLEDTDGDGFSDLDEIKLGKDPLCAEGTDCTIANGSVVVQSTSTTNVVTDTNPADNIDQTLLTKALNGEGTPDTMRQILLQAGGDPEQIKLLTDNDLMSLYQDVLKSQNLNTATSTTIATSSIINK